MNQATLYWKDQPLGRLTDVAGDFPWFTGSFTPTARAEELRAFFEFMVDEAEVRDPSDVFEEGLLDPESWSLVDELGEARGIEVPAVHWEDRTIDWRYR